jgi:hypothetical protein
MSVRRWRSGGLRAGTRQQKNQSDEADQQLRCTKADVREHFNTGTDTGRLSQLTLA